MAAPSIKFREASKTAQTGWSESPQNLLSDHPAPPHQEGNIHVDATLCAKLRDAVVVNDLPAHDSQNGLNPLEVFVGNCEVVSVEHGEVGMSADFD